MVTPNPKHPSLSEKRMPSRNALAGQIFAFSWLGILIALIVSSGKLQLWLFILIPLIMIVPWTVFIRWERRDWTCRRYKAGYTESLFIEGLTRQGIPADLATRFLAELRKTDPDFPYMPEDDLYEVLYVEEHEHASVARHLATQLKRAMPQDVPDIEFDSLLALGLYLTSLPEIESPVELTNL